VCSTSDLEISWAYAGQVEIVLLTVRLVGSCFTAECKAGVNEEDASQQSVRHAARRLALDAQAVLRKERAGRELRVEGLAVAVLTAFAERGALVRDAERRVG
jgi:hypothetical protein